MLSFETHARLVLSDSHGIYIPQLYCSHLDAADAEYLKVDFADVKVCQTGPDHEWYWEAWQSILDSAQFECDGLVYCLFQSGDLWEVPMNCEIPDLF